MDLPVCYFLSLKSGQPVKMVMDYSEEFIAGNPRHSSIINIKTGVKKDGTIVAHQMRTEIIDYIESYMFNSNKCFAVFRR